MMVITVVTTSTSSSQLLRAASLPRVSVAIHLDTARKALLTTLTGKITVCMYVTLSQITFKTQVLHRNVFWLPSSKSVQILATDMNYRTESIALQDQAQLPSALPPLPVS